MMKFLETISAERIQRWLHETVDTYSPTWAELPVLEVFEEMLNEARLPYRKQFVDDERYNLIVELGPQPAAMIWVGHVDTVALYDEEHRHPYVQDGVLFGLGSADMKSGCVAAVAALAALRESKVVLKNGIKLALVVGEEEYGDGSEHLIRELLDANLETLPVIVIGEPTNLKPCVSHFGYFECFLNTRGARAHAALPEVGDNAIHAMLTWMTRILEAQRQKSWGSEVAFTPRKIDGGSPLFAVPETCEAVLDVHLPPHIDFDEIQSLLEQTLEDTRRDHQGCEFSFEVAFAAPGFDQVTVSSAVQDAYVHVMGVFEPHAFRSHSDAAMFHEAGMQTIVSGPGMLEVAHTPDEHVHLDQVTQAARLYATMFHIASQE